MTILFDSKNLRKVTTFALGLFQVEAPMPKSEPATPAYDARTDNADSWGARFDAAKARYRDSLRKPVAPPVALTEAEVDAEIEAMDEAFAVRMAQIEDNEALMRRHEARVNAETDADRWNVVPDIHPVEAPAQASPRRRASAPSPIDQAWNLGYELGRDGHAATPTARMSDDEAAAFIGGWDQGAAHYRDEEFAAAEAYCRLLEQTCDPIDDIEDGELCEARMARPLYHEA